MLTLLRSSTRTCDGLSIRSRVAVVAVACAAMVAAQPGRADERAREQELAARRAAQEKALKEQAVLQAVQAQAEVVVQLQENAPQIFPQPGGVMDLGASFDQMVFSAAGPNPVPPGADTAARLTQVRKAGEERIEKIHRIVTLSAEQRAKLRVAMEADVGRLAEEIDAVRAGYVGQKVTLGEDGAGREQIQKVSEDAAACRRLMAAAFGPTALLSKVLGDTLDERQNTLYSDTMAARRGTVWKALIGSALVANDGVLGLTQAQHEAVEALLMADVPPLALDLPGQRVGGAVASPAGLVLLRLEQAGEEKLTRVLDPRQRAVVAALARQVGEPAEVQAQLVAGGILEDNP